MVTINGTPLEQASDEDILRASRETEVPNVDHRRLMDEELFRWAEIRGLTNRDLRIATNGRRKINPEKSAVLHRWRVAMCAAELSFLPDGTDIVLKDEEEDDSTHPTRDTSAHSNARAHGREAGISGPVRASTHAREEAS